MINWRKREGSKAITSKVSDLKIRYEQTKDTSYLMIATYLTDYGYTTTGSGYKDAVDRLDVALFANTSGGWPKGSTYKSIETRYRT